MLVETSLVLSLARLVQHINPWMKKIVWHRQTRKLYCVRMVEDQGMCQEEITEDESETSSLVLFLFLFFFTRSTRKRKDKQKAEMLEQSRSIRSLHLLRVIYCRPLTQVNSMNTPHAPVNCLLLHGHRRTSTCIQKDLGTKWRDSSNR
jgi:hypothetical protein